MNTTQQELIQKGLKGMPAYAINELSGLKIETKAGIARGALAKNFNSKENYFLACYDFIVKELLSANRSYLKQWSATTSNKELTRQIWFNSIAWWLSEPHYFCFFRRFRLSKWYEERYEDIILSAGAYTNLARKGKDVSRFPDTLNNFAYELVVEQIINVVNYLRRHPEWSTDTHFLKSTFEAMWASIQR